MNNEVTTQETIVQNQLEAYNLRDIDKFLSFYSNDIKVFNFNEATPFINGLEDLRTIYSEVFENSPNLNASITNRIVFDNKIIDEEEVTGRKGINYIKVIVIYEIVSNLINKVTFIKKK